MTTLLITRPAEEAEPLKEALSAGGYGVFSEPLLSIESLEENKPELTAALAHKPGAILATSRHALITAEDMAAMRGIPAFTVGKATLERAVALGYAHGGWCETAEALPALVERHFAARRPRLLYLRGEDISTDIATPLESKGFTLDSVILYRATQKPEFSRALQSEMAKGGIAGALFFSRRTAETYAHLVEKHDLMKAHEGMHAICMSGAIAERLNALPWQHIHVAQKPELESMIEAVKSATAYSLSLQGEGKGEGLSGGVACVPPSLILPLQGEDIPGTGLRHTR